MKRFLIPFLLLLSQCGNPVDFKRDGDRDPLSDTYRPTSASGIAVTFTADWKVRLGWNIGDSQFDSILIHRKTTVDSAFIHVASLPNTARSFIDSSGVASYPMAFTITTWMRRDGKEFKTTSSAIPVPFGVVNKPVVTFNPALTTINLTTSSSIRYPFYIDIWVRGHFDTEFTKLPRLTGQNSTFTRAAPYSDHQFYADVAVVAHLDAQGIRSVIDSNFYVLPIHLATSLTINPFNERLGVVSWSNPFSFHDDILLQVTQNSSGIKQEWILPKEATSFELARYFKSGVTYEINLRYRLGNERSSQTSTLRSFTIQPPSLAYAGPTYPEVNFRFGSNTATTSSFRLGDYYVLEASRDMGPFVPLDSVKITSTSQIIHAMGLDTLSTYRLRARTLTSQPSASVALRRKVTFGERSESSNPWTRRITWFDPYSDRFYGFDASNQPGIFDVLTGDKLMSLPGIGTSAPNGFMKSGHFVARTASTSTNVTLRRYNVSGTALEEFNLSATKYIFGHHDDVIYVNTETWNIERYHIPTATTTILLTGMPQSTVTAYAVSETHLLVKSGTRFILFTHDSSGTYTLHQERSLSSLSRDPNYLSLSPNHIRLAYFAESVHSVDILTGNVQSFNSSAYPPDALHLTDNEWVFFNGSVAIIRDVTQTTETRVTYQISNTSSFTSRIGKARIDGNHMDLFFMRTSNESGTPNQRIWLTKREFWVAE